jgi:hypothetical protein
MSCPEIGLHVNLFQDKTKLQKIHLNINLKMISTKRTYLILIIIATICTLIYFFENKKKVSSLSRQNDLNNNADCNNVEYIEKSIRMFKTEKYNELLQFSSKISNGCDSIPQANFDLFNTIYIINCKKNKQNVDDNYLLDNINTDTLKIAIDNLVKAADKKHPQAKYILGLYYIKGNYVNKDLKKGLKYLKNNGYLPDDFYKKPHDYYDLSK